jgi:AraC family ethanolamine operon transcriptional activator
MRTFGLLMRRSSRIYWRGQQVTGEDIFAFPPGGELDSVTQNDFEAFTFSLPAGTLSAVCEALELPDIDQLLDGREVFRIDAGDMVQLKRLLSFGVTGSGRKSNVNKAPATEKFAYKLSKQLVRALSRAREVAQQRRSSTRRTKALRVVDHFIADNVGRPLRLDELCRAANVSERTLGYAFRDQLGVTPKAYANAYRLNTAKKALRLADPEKIKVSDVAEAAGFGHMSQFSADYHALFGELPSETFRRTVV